jgi:hypothetical protein
MEISILHIYKSILGPSNSDGSNNMGCSNLFESPANFQYIFKLKQNISLEHWYLEQSNLINDPINNKITSFTISNSNIAI